MKKYNIDFIFNGQNFSFDKVYVAIDATMLFLKKENNNTFAPINEQNIVAGFNLDYIKSITLTECTDNQQ